MDLIAIDIQREYDVGLGTLNQTRQAIGLRQFASFAQLTSDPVLQNNLQAVYGSIDNVDLFIGGLAEKHATGAIVGPTFQAIIADQFQALRAGDRFFWQNQGFDPQTAAMIANTTLTNIIQRNTATTKLQANVFVESALPTHVKPHAPTPAVVDTHGRKGCLSSMMECSPAIVCFRDAGLTVRTEEDHPIVRWGDCSTHCCDLARQFLLS